MKQTKILTLLFAIFLGQTVLAQKKLPIIKANSTSVDIKDDNNLRKNAWTIVPEEKLDVYTTSAKKVTFYTDIDSISFKIDPKKLYNFIILVNGKDPATTAVQTMSNGIATVNTDVASQLGIDYSVFDGMCEKIVEIQTAEEFE